jgi:hypothetical protein
LTFFTLPSNYGIALHKKLFSLVYNSNGGFNWHDVYFMPVKLREFYWRELLDAKEAEAKVYQNAQTPSPPTRKTSRR